MIRKEAANIIKECKEKGFKHTFYTLNDYHTALDMAIKALEQEPCDKYIKVIGHLRKYISKLETQIVEQEPCEDCKSKQAVIDIVDSYSDSQSNVEDVTQDIISDIMALPSAQPETHNKRTEKTGRWISFGIQGEIDGQIVRVFTCSECGAISIFRVSNGNIVNGNLCPNCGAKMWEEGE